MNPNNDPSTFVLLFEELLEGTITEESRARLICMMRADRTLVEAVSRQLLVSGALDRLKAGYDDESVVRLISEHAFRVGSEEENAFVSQVKRRISHRRIGQFAAAAVLILSMGALVYHQVRKRQDAKGSFVTMIEVNAEGKIISTHKIGKGYKLKAREGLFRLDFANGAIVAIEAPASFEVVSGWAMRLHSGNLNAWCPETAHGFQVLTATTKVTDLGTSFAISATADGNADILVLNGLIDVSEGKDTRRLKAGQALRSEGGGGGLRSVLFQTESFTRTWPLASGILSTQGSVNPAPPGTYEQLSKIEDNASVFVIPEKRDVVPTQPIEVELIEPGEISLTQPGVRQPLVLRPGKRLRSFLIRYNPVGRGLETRAFSGSVTFDRPVMAICASGSVLNASDPIFATGSPNPDAADAEFRGLDFDQPAVADYVELSGDRHTVSISFHAGVSTDDIRVIVEEDGSGIP